MKKIYSKEIFPCFYVKHKVLSSDNEKVIKYIKRKESYTISSFEMGNINGISVRVNKAPLFWLLCYSFTYRILWWFTKMLFYAEILKWNLQFTRSYIKIFFICHKYMSYKIFGIFKLKEKLFITLL